MECRRLIEGAPGFFGIRYEIKHDGYRLIVSRRGDRVRLFTRRGCDWTHYPLIRAAAEALPAEAMIDGAAVVCVSTGIRAGG